MVAVADTEYKLLTYKYYYILVVKIDISPQINDKIIIILELGIFKFYHHDGKSLNQSVI